MLRKECEKEKRHAQVLCAASPTCCFTHICSFTHICCFTHFLLMPQARSFASLHAAHTTHAHDTHAPSTTARPPPKGLVRICFPSTRVIRVVNACNRVAMAAWRLHLAEPHVDFAAEMDAYGGLDADWDGTKSSLQLHSEVRMFFCHCVETCTVPGDMTTAY